MTRRLYLSALVALALAAAPELLAQKPPAAPPKKNPLLKLAEPWPEDDVIATRKTEAQTRKLFQDEAPFEFTLTSDFGLLNKERTPNNNKQFPGVLTVDGKDIQVKLNSRGHLRLNPRTCSFVPIRVEFAKEEIAGTIFDGQTNLKLGTHCQNEKEFDQFVQKEYLTYKLANLVTPFSFRARLAKATYVDAKSKKQVSQHNAVWLEHENDVARRLSGRDVSLPRIEFKDLDKDSTTMMMLLEYILGNTDYSIWALHNVGHHPGQEADALPGGLRLRHVRDGASAVRDSRSAPAPPQRHRSALSRTLPDGRRVQRRRRAVPRQEDRHDRGRRRDEGAQWLAQRRDEGLYRELLPDDREARVDQEELRGWVQAAADDVTTRDLGFGIRCESRIPSPEFRRLYCCGCCDEVFAGTSTTVDQNPIIISSQV